ncbi:MAG: succinate dehydrogenase, cytochrome b556 subunit [Candidatus Marinimicrobia bacterium]|nr:succinate dehydrogenase, cytochrome b556 subunit [Candidatus Neomarinimicrobiota bacterium]
MKLNTLQEWKLNFNWGMLAFILHRVTGMALVIYIIAHIYSLSHILGGTADFDHFMRGYDTTLGHIIEYLLLLAFLWHMFNGLRITVTDFLRFSHQQKRLVIWVFILSAIVALASLTHFIPEIKPLLGLGGAL